MSALQLRRQLGIGRYETAWTMLHKLRRAMRRPERERLRGEVEVDETYVGHEENLRGGRQAGTRAIVVGAVEVRGDGSGRLRLQVIPDASGPSLTGFIQANVEPGTTVLTDGWHGYSPLSRTDYPHLLGVNYTCAAATITLAHRDPRVRGLRPRTVGFSLIRPADRSRMPRRNRAPPLPWRRELPITFAQTLCVAGLRRKT